jgi:hypothetical protein
MPLYDLAGLTLHSPLPLPGAAYGAGPADVEVTLEQPVTGLGSDGDVVAELMVNGRLRYRFSQGEAGYVGHFPDTVDFLISKDLRAVACVPAPGVPRELVAILLAGAVTAFIHGMGGRFVLHASAVEVDGRVFAILGRSGSGKTTVAAAMCAGGATLISDDVLVVSTRSERLECRGTSAELRLRATAAVLVDEFSPRPSVRRTTDDRLALTPPATNASATPLGGLLFPRLDRERTVLELMDIEPGAAVGLLLQGMRIEGWQRPEHIRQNFEDACTVAGRVPAFALWVPWGPDGHRQLSTSAIEAVRRLP